MRTIETFLRLPTRSGPRCRAFAWGAYFMVSLVPSLASPAAFAETQLTTDCAGVTVVENEPIFKKVDQGRQKRMMAIRQDQCDAVNNSKTTVENANYAIHEFLVREKNCVGNGIAPERRKALLEPNDDFPSTLIRSFEKYCRDTSDPGQNLEVNWKVLVKSRHWMGNEIFCQHTRHLVERDSKALAFFHVSDSPSFKRLHDQALSLCDALREGKLNYDEADYRWKQEVYWYLRQSNLEGASKIGSAIEEALKFVSSLASK